MPDFYDHKTNRTTQLPFLPLKKLTTVNIEKEFVPPCGRELKRRTTGFSARTGQTAINTDKKKKRLSSRLSGTSLRTIPPGRERRNLKASEQDRFLAPINRGGSQAPRKLVPLRRNDSFFNPAYPVILSKILSHQFHRLEFGTGNLELKNLQFVISRSLRQEIF